MQPPTEDDARRSLDALTDAALDKLFAGPSRVGVDSAWDGHVPFAAWIVEATRPSLFVELGTHAGVSYAAFCDAVTRARLPTRCVAVDSWKGDEHAAFYGEEVFADLKAFNDARYGAFSTLKRATFDEALEDFAEASIDLLHIDGRHFYEDVRHDFESWRPKLSERAVVLFHDTQVRERDFGVWRLWAELSLAYPNFEFTHAHGLGVLAFGTDVLPSVATLCAMTGTPRATVLRERMSVIGGHWSDQRRIDAAEREVVRLSDALHHAGGALTRERNALDHAHNLAAALSSVTAGQAALVAAHDRLRSELAEADARAKSADARARSADARAALADARATSAEAAQDAGQRAALIATEAGRAEAADLRATIASLEQVAAASLLRRAARRMRRYAGRSSRSPPFASPLAETAPEVQAVVPAQSEAELAPTAEAAPPRRRRVLFASGEPDTAGHRYRVEHYAEAARAIGWDAEAVPVIALSEAAFEQTDVVVFWRAAWSRNVAFAHYLARRAGAVTVFDVDDLMVCPDLARVDVIDGIRSQYFAEEMIADLFVHMRMTMDECDLCICPTEELAYHLRSAQKPTFVLSNGFDDATWRRSRRAVRARESASDGLVRIGYAAGSRTHQRDLKVAAPGLARLLRSRPECRLVLFTADWIQNGWPVYGPPLPLIDLAEIPELDAVAGQIEWRTMVPLRALPDELARFDINIAPLEAGNPFCEAKSELKYFEAALVSVPTVASPTGPYVRAIAEGETGCLASDDEGWFSALDRLIADAALRRRMGQAAYHDSLWRFGPHAREEALLTFLDQAGSGQSASRSFELGLRRAAADWNRPLLADAEVRFRSDWGQDADVTVLIRLFNYEELVVEALDSVLAQTLVPLDLVVVDDASTDASGAVALAWMQSHAHRLNRVSLLRHTINGGLGIARNTGFAAAETPYVLVLDADNKLRPHCAERLLAALKGSRAAFAYPKLEAFGDNDNVFGAYPFQAMRFAGGNYIDAMALVAVWAWAGAGAPESVRHGWEDYDLWCRMVERGLWGVPVDEVLADYRVHESSMLRTSVDHAERRRSIVAELRAAHPWLQIPG